ncbi:hypothetical protein ACKWRH_31005 [Bradyrhizobium sp. Pa8]|uniref:hypothetical protein n=1 Tax=Bradyrhizobium sp. Pa8 TaxID=3386552 RepID=UPI00403F02F6
MVVLEGRVPERLLRLRSDRVRLQLDGCTPLWPCDLNAASGDKRLLGLGVHRVSLVAVGNG